MKISLDWLRTLIPTDKPAEEIGKLLTGSGLEVEGIEELESVPGGLRGLVLGTVLTCEKHPDADKLSLTTVDVGDAVPRQIVCGAANVRAGLKVVVALEGAELHPTEGQPFKIKKSKIRGAASEGMICAEDEIGLGTSHAGIMELDTELPNGTPAAEYFGLGSDSVFEIGLTPNRADAASHYGVARELRALLRQPCHLPDISQFHAPAEAAQNISVEIEDAEASPRYAGLLLENVHVGPSPEWLQRRLRSIGLSPINNVVDVTNFVLHELGQPLHAFDADQITGGKIRVKRAEAGEKFTTLDGLERTLKPEDLVIADANGAPMALAGVFGGKTSGVSDQTTRIFLESAYFQPAAVRKSGQVHQLKTDASFRFERGTDPHMVPVALKRAALLLQEVAGATVAAPVVDVYPTHIGHMPVRLRLPRVEKLVGQFIAPERIRQILTDLDILIAEELTDEAGHAEWILSVPPHKVDVTREADVIEEILRIYGYNHVALRPHNSASFLAKFPNPDPEIIRQNTARLLSGQGFSEIITNSITNSLYFQKEGETDETLVPLLNFNSADLNVMRPTMLHSGLEVIRYNVNRRQRDLKLYEFGKTYHRLADGAYQENNKLVIYITGNSYAETWQQKSEKATYHQLAGAVQQVLASLGFPSPTSQPVQHPYLAGGLTLLAQNQPVAQLGAVSNAVLKRLDVSQPVWYAELDWDWLMRKYKNTLVGRELPKFPEVRRDLSLVVDKTVTFDQLQQIARRTEKKLLQSLNVFDIYEGENLGADKKSYSVSFLLQDPTQTLTDQAIDGVMQRLIQQFEKQAGALIRK
ncbi:phenylalanine--tRNA ligase subunit beta [Hymenobacter taeanensis]|uniref:Phenylalanine--tRNA ligase beta subunit n=1 Tax=Hymenobacter taeanensis TaxID=2735321 RepID=A0A6M6BJY0_9BACT|nr:MULTISPECIES: phenylalanine--tRNA ligase subunit beta [Hymenobacter]QJX47385.1 phenylalanine--tRNA ligase subunit beta [Hymenobacter taeanensis]UOQ79275.1 phenylalanine--tRNA ligase subunit beta [Hymenobacter sp. 5414T-23]